MDTGASQGVTVAPLYALHGMGEVTSWQRQLESFESIYKSLKSELKSNLPAPLTSISIYQSTAPSGLHY